MLWEDNIDSELINLFLDRIFYMCNNSIYDMERFLSDIACSESQRPLEMKLCEGCTLVEDSEVKQFQMEEELSEMENELDLSESELKKMRKTCLFLKDNSVIFSLEEIDINEDPDSIF